MVFCRRLLVACAFACASLLAASSIAAPTPQFFTYYALGASFAEAR